ncbi:MAG: ATP-dependent DNA helicase RecG [Brevinematales bacterium]|nr:ATP-dependent DNA helicase RecG [Brevinematales bacterium]
MYLNDLKEINLKETNLFTPRQLHILDKLGLLTVYDVLTYFPYRYEDRSTVESIESSILNKKPVCTIVRVVEHQSIFFKNKKHPKIIVEDSKMRASLVGFNREFLFKTMKIGKRYWLYAEFILKFDEIQTSTFDFEEYIENTPPKNFGKVFPIYSITEGTTVKELRNLVEKVINKYINEIADELPNYMINGHKLISKNQALRSIHFPENIISLRKARFRIGFEELFAIQLVVMLKRKNLSLNVKNFNYTKEELIKQTIKNLQFKLTNAQEKALFEIIKDMKNKKPMHRLLQGDVGSGKTIVAFLAMIFASENGYQSALLVPTEVLAFQHYNNLFKIAENLGLKMAVLTKSSENKEDIILKLKRGEINLIVGTHALLQEEVNFHNLALIVFDEQHRFGVEQRIIMAKKGNNPDILVMTATPIPRTLSLTVYGDLDISIIDEMPSGRKPVITKWFRKEVDYEKLIRFVTQELRKGRQAYFIYPLIEESEKLNAEDAIKNYNKLKRLFSEFKVGLLHGKMPSEEKMRIMQDFKLNKINILVSTTVIEVGIDVKNATIIVIEGAERFGLSQLHQLRGRVGRGEEQSYCALVTSCEETEDIIRRMEVICNYNDGFKIAEEDLKIRGPGEILGIKQSGMPELKISEFLHDEKLLKVAREDAINIIEYDPELGLEKHKCLKDGILKHLPIDYLYSG